MTTKQPPRKVAHPQPHLHSTHTVIPIEEAANENRGGQRRHAGEGRPDGGPRAESSAFEDLKPRATLTGLP